VVSVVISSEQYDFINDLTVTVDCPNAQRYHLIYDVDSHDNFYKFFRH